MEAQTPAIPLKRLEDYRPPDWIIPSAGLRFELDSERSIVHARLDVVRNGDHDRPLQLDGEELELLSLSIDGVGQPLPNPGPEGLSLSIPAARATVETVVAVRPIANSRLMGLYASGGNLCTQCEAEGFRRITFWPDRPDVLSTFHVRLEADRAQFPVLLSNGNPVAAGDLADGRHFSEWDDPFPKPSYLFALVAGRLSALTDRFTTRSGRDVALAIWVAESDVPRASHAMHSLKQSMAWDEQAYGREYDLDSFNIVAVHDFNFGAMENKGLNIFNAKYVLADPDTATDWDFDSIAAIVAHEYFHNWSGNRVTCRDWFQLCLKEGFTVFRDQSFSESLGSASVRRIEQVRALRSGQFPEDEGPLAHPVRPQSYMEISNFYTATVYNKGAELIRMMHRILGSERFRAATDRYFAENDGTAATVEDFLSAMEQSGLRSDLFRRWYEQPGTPRLTTRLEQAADGITLHVAQANPRAGADAPPLPIPLSFALFAADGSLLAEREEMLTARTASYALPAADGPVTLSFNRGFAAPVIVHPLPAADDLSRLAAHETDPFARYEALQQLMLGHLIAVTGGEAGDPDAVVGAVAAALDGWRDDPALVAETILIPSESFLGDQLGEVDPEAVHRARDVLRRLLADALGERLWTIWDATGTDGADLSAHAKGLRRLRGVALSLLAVDDSAESVEAAWTQFTGATSMTDRMSALGVLASSQSPRRTEALARFRERYAALPEVMDKWFLVQAGSARASALADVEALTRDPLYDARNPNRLRSLVLGFTANMAHFHDRSGAGYAFLEAQAIASDRVNPQSAARLVQPLTRWRRMAEPWRGMMRETLARIADQPSLSKDMLEVVTNSLK